VSATGHQFGDPDAGRSVARYLGLTMEEVGEVREGAATVLGHASAPAYLRSADGTIAMGALRITASDMPVKPNSRASSDLSPSNPIPSSPTRYS